MADDHPPLQNPQKLPLKYRLILPLLSFVSHKCLRPNMTVNRSLISLFESKVSSSSPRDGVFTCDTVIDPSRNLWFRLFVPSSTPHDLPIPLLIYFHGGGFVFFSPDFLSFDTLCRKLARELQAIVVSVNYRLSPEHRYPSQYEDGFDALKFIDDLDSSAFPKKSDFGRCFIAGDSAGGNIAHHVVVRSSDYNFKKVKIRGLIAIQPFFGGEERTESEIRFGRSPTLNLERADWYWKAFLPDGANRNHGAAHVFGEDGVNISAVKFPATLVIVGGSDQLRDWDRKYYEWLKKAGKEVELVEYPKAIHGFYVISELPETWLLIEEAKNFIEKVRSSVNHEWNGIEDDDRSHQM
uniref:Esterase n=1 Tax=Cucumis melo TaxID=3656 RepID=A5Y726_CUCME|nr:esterase [Cucumis melo]